MDPNAALGVSPVSPITADEKAELDFLRHVAAHSQRRLAEVEAALDEAELERDTIRHERNLMAQDFAWTLDRLDSSPVGPALRRMEGFRPDAGNLGRRGQVTNSVLFVGRLAATDIERDDAHTIVLDATTHVKVLASEMREAEAVYIEDPMSFPWDSIDRLPDAPITLNTSEISSDALTALGPVLRRLSRFDVLQTSGDSDQLRLARALGIRTESYAASELAAVRRAKRLDRIESGLIERWNEDFDTTVVDAADLASGAWVAPSSMGHNEGQPCAVIVRLPQSTITAQRAGFESFARRLIAQVSGTHVIDVASVHAQPGAPVERGLVLIGVSP